MPSPLVSISAALGIIPLGFGINAFLRPDNAISWFNNTVIPTGENEALVRMLIWIYGVRDIYMGIAVLATAYYGSRRALGWVMLSAFMVGMVDGLAAKTFLGGGEWDHWGYSPVLAVIGAILAFT